MREFERIRAYLALDVGKAEILRLLGISEAAKQSVAAQEPPETEPPLSTVARRAADQAKSMLAERAAKVQQQQQQPSAPVRQAPSEAVASAQVNTARPAVQQKGGRPADTSDKTAATLEADRPAGAQAAGPQPNMALRQRVPVPTADRAGERSMPDRSHTLHLRRQPQSVAPGDDHCRR